MALGTGIGQARALLREGGEDYWMKRLASEAQAAKIEKAKQKAKQQEELATTLDFKIDYGKYLPAWGKEVAGVYANFINDYATMRQQDPNVSPLAVQVKAQEAKRRIAELEVQNEMAKKYLAEKDIKRNEQFDKALVSFDSNFETLNQLSNRGMYHVSPQGSFNYREIPSKEIKIDWGTPMEESMPVSKGGFNEIKMDFPAQYESFMIEQKKNDPIFRNQIMYELSEQNKDYEQKDNETDFQYSERMDDIVNMEIENRVRANRPPGFLKFETRATGGGGGGGAKKQNYPVTQTPVSVFRPERGGVADNPVVWDEKVTPVKSSINVISNGKFVALDERKNEWLPKGLTFNFRPQKTVITPVQGKNKMYVQGIVTQNVGEDATGIDLYSLLGENAPGTKEKWQNTYTVMVPYEGAVKTLIEGNNDMTDIIKVFESKTKKGGGYSSAQETGIQNVMKANNISREEAIQALKDAGKL